LQESIKLCSFAETKLRSRPAATAFAFFWFQASKPLEEPVAWYGPIVMNTQEPLRDAFNELQEGTFLKEGQRK
jgi:redox-sensitive bicupin YhaK (pirin superfamily)